MKMKQVIFIGSLLILAAGSITAYTVHQKTKVHSQEKDIDKAKKITLSDYKDEKHIEDADEIRQIVKDYNLENSENIEEIIYYPLTSVEKEDVDSKLTTYESGLEEYYIKKKTSYEKKGGVLRSSWYNAPGGSMTIKQSISTTSSFSNSSSVEGSTEVLRGILKSSYGFSVTKNISIADTQKVTVKSGCKRNCKAYVNYKVYNFELWEDDVKYDDYIGKGSIKRPVGIIFTIGSNIKKDR